MKNPKELQAGFRSSAPAGAERRSRRDNGGNLIFNKTRPSGQSSGKGLGAERKSRAEEQEQEAGRENIILGY